ncbi:MAG: hypothetical protein R3A44_02160 [Caldilineaceae bacterium]
MGYQVTFPNQQIITLPPATVAAIAASKAKYAEPLWHFRAERVLKLGGHQWIFPSDMNTAYALYETHPGGIIATAWKLFNRSWCGATEEYFVDRARYPDHPRHLGENVVPLVDEDNDSQQIGWVRINQVTQADENYAVFVQFTLLELFPARPLPAAYL